MKIGERIDELHALREDIRKLTKTLSELKEQFNTKEFELMHAMQQVGLDQAKSDRTTVSLKTETVGTIEDWDQFQTYVKDNDAMYLLHRRLSNTAYRELLLTEGEVPGVKETELTKLSMLST
jgi:hypothetical protein